MAFTAHLPCCCRSVATDSLLLSGVQHDRLPCPSLSPGFCLNSYPLSWWHYATISSSVSPFSSPQSFPTSGSFPTSWLFAPGGQSIGTSASASLLPMNIQDSFPLGWTGWISLQSKGPLKNLLQHHNLKASIFQLPAFFMVQHSHLYMTTGKNHSFDCTNLCQQNDVSAFKYTLWVCHSFSYKEQVSFISWLQSPSMVILEPKKIKSTSTFPPSICDEEMGPDAMILAFLMLSFKQAFSLSFFTLI